MNQFVSLFICVAFVAFVQANTFNSGSSDGTSFRSSFSAPSLTFTSNSEIEIQYFAQYLAPSSGYQFNAVVIVADVNTAAVLYASAPFTLYNYGTGWYNSSYLGWDLPATNSSKYSIGMMIDVQAYYYYSTTQTNTDGILSSYLDNGNFAGSFAVSTFTCCGAVNLYSSITYTPTNNPPPSGNVFTSGSNYTFTSRTPYYATALAFQTNTPVTITQFSHYINPQVSFGSSFNAEVVIANLNTSTILYTSGAFSLTAYGPAFYSLPFNLSFALTPGTRYAIGMMTDVTTYYYYSLSQVSTDGTLFGYPSNANFAGSFYNPSIDCCYSANIYSQIQYVYSNSTPNGTGTFTSGNATASNYRSNYNAAALTFMSNTGITLTSVSQYLYPQGGTPFSGMVVVANLNTSQIVYTSSVFPLQQNGSSVAQFYSSPSINVTLQPFVMYSVGIMINVPTYIYYSTGGGNTDGTITSYARNANFNGNFQSQTIDCCYSANIYTTLTYTSGNPPPPPNNNTGNFTSGGSTQNAYRYAFNPAALNVQSNTNWVLTSVSQYLNPTGSSFQGMVLVANLNTSQIVYTSPTFWLTGYGQGWYTSPSINVSLSAYTNYGIAIMLNTQTYIFYLTNDGGNTDGTLTSFDANANFVGNFSSPVVQCCASANIYTSLTYTTNYVPPPPSTNTTNFTSGSPSQSAYRSSYNPAALNFASNTPIVLSGVSQWLAPSVTAGTPFAGMVVVANLNTSTIFWTSPIFPLVSYSSQGAWYSSPSFNLSLDSGVNYAIGIMLNVSTYIYYSTSGGNSDGTITSYARNANFQGSFMSPSIDCCYSANVYTTLTYSTGYLPPSGNNFTAGDSSLSTYRYAFNDAILNFKSNSDFVLTSVSQYLNPVLGNVSAVAVVANLNTNQILYISPVWTFQAYGYSGWVSSPSLSVSLQAGVNYGVGVVLNTATYLFYNSNGNTDGVMTSYVSNGNIAGSDFNSLSVSCCASATIYTSFTYTLGEEGNSLTFRNYKSEMVENIQGASADALDE